MKKIIVYASSLLLIFLASCSTSGFVMKRKYNKGYYVDFANNNNHKKANDKVKDASDNLSFKKMVLQSEAKELSIQENAPTAFSQNIQVKKKSNPSFNKKSSSQSNITLKKWKALKPLVKKTISKKEKHTLKKDGGDISIVEVILSLFPILCLIAIYLHDGNKITMNFWVDLLLHLTFIGEIIYALLVVLNIFSLS
jgi:preprotein translocase subunit SecF